MAQTVLQLGDLTFAGLEVPARLPFGGNQSLTVHKLVGGARVVDAMGPDDKSLAWSGWFMGENALARALYLDTQRKLGQALVLTWAQMRYLVVIESFEPNYQRINEIPYTISCVVAEDQTSPVTTIASANIDDQMSDDMDTANGLGGLIGDGPLSGLLGGLDAAIGAVSSFANASQSVISGVLQPIGAVQSRLQTLVASSINTTQNITTAGGVLPNTPASQSVAALGGQVASFEQQPLLFSLQNVVGRMGANLGSVTGNSQTITTAGGNLYDLASKQYGDATSWTAIAKANNLSDPQVVGVQSLIVPKQPDTAGGILGL